MEFLINNFKLCWLCFLSPQVNTFLENHSSDEAAHVKKMLVRSLEHAKSVVPPIVRGPIHKTIRKISTGEIDLKHETRTRLSALKDLVKEKSVEYIEKL